MPACPTPACTPLQPSPSRREDRPVSFYQLGANAASLARDTASLAKEKQRSYVPSILQNETYGAILSGSPPPSQPAAPSTTSAPPLPPRNVAKGTELLVALPEHNGCSWGFCFGKFVLLLCPQLGNSRVRIRMGFSMWGLFFVISVVCFLKELHHS